MIQIRLAFLVVASAGVVLLPASPAPAASDDTAIANLERQRRSAGLPADLRLRDALSGGCRKHNRYMERNHTLTHFERPDKPGFSRAGAEAGLASVLAFAADPWSTPRRNPWEPGPVNLAQTLDPSLLVTGYDESANYSCLQTLTSPRRPPPSRLELYTYPGPGKTIYRAERASEGPFPPGHRVGIPRGATTGPYIMILLDGPNRAALDEVEVISATIRKVGGGRVRVEAIGSADSFLRPVVPPLAYLIPRRPLEANERYRANAFLRVGGKVVHRKWSFRTNASVNSPRTAAPRRRAG